ncbi:hypothetical protein JXA63_00055 [Candidatus Woesebacteria bacterium]|nr:hypothetical protein [Candidatus Woesebacteria bacterium]
MKYHKPWTTHIPMLIKAVQITDGPVLEIGSGPFSTPLLHWLLAEANRKLVTYESDKEYFNAAQRFKSRSHSIRFVENWDKVDFGKNHWSVCLIDHEIERRQIESVRLKNIVDFFVLHDTNHPDYGYDNVWPHFKHIHHWKYCRPWTSVVSNFKSIDPFKSVDIGKDPLQDTTISKLLSDFATDKNLNTKGGHCYGKAYDGLFSSFDRDAELDIIEIGTEYGKSLLAWREFFPNANITGVDIEDKVEKKRKDITYKICDVKDLKPRKRYDIVIDDGSHKLSDVVHVVKNFKLKVGGMMIIEDCQAPHHWLERIKTITNYSIETIDMRKVNGQHDDFMIVVRNYGYFN